jgi:acyl-CoA synthetase (NDP forming)
VLTVFLSAKGAPPALATGARGRLPSYSFPENAARALAAAERYGRWRSRPRGEPIRLTARARGAVRAIVERALGEHDQAFWLETADVQDLLRACDIPVADARLVAPDRAPALAESMGYPLVAKAVAAGLIHKSDVGGVILGLHSESEVRSAVSTLRERLALSGRPLERVLLQREVPAGLEMLVGVVTDPTFGPLVACGFGGVQVELLRDAAFRLPPVTDVDAGEMIDHLRMKALLDGYRGMPPADRTALMQLVQRVSALAEAVPELRELDLNPVKVLGRGEGVVVVDARLRLGPLTAADLG